MARRRWPEQPLQCPPRTQPSTSRSGATCNLCLGRASRCPSRHLRLPGAAGPPQHFRGTILTGRGCGPRTHPSAPRTRGAADAAPCQWSSTASPIPPRWGFRRRRLRQHRANVHLADRRTVWLWPWQSESFAELVFRQSRYSRLLGGVCCSGQFDECIHAPCCRSSSSCFRAPGARLLR